MASNQESNLVHEVASLAQKFESFGENMMLRFEKIGEDFQRIVKQLEDHKVFQKDYVTNEMLELKIENIQLQITNATKETNTYVKNQRILLGSVFLLGLKEIIYAFFV